LSVLLGKVGNFQAASLVVGQVQISWGNFLAVFVDFVVIALVVYFGVKWLKLDRLDKKE
jgi:large-conductance mechanosensitive channel